VADGIAAGCFGLANEGWVDPYMLAALFRKAAVAQGVEIVTGEVTGLTREGNRISGATLASGEAIDCGTLVNAAGTGAGKLAAMAGVALPVGPRKRYVYVLDCPQATDALRKAPLTVFPGGVYFRPEGRNFLCGLSPEEHEEPAEMDWEVDHAWFEERIWPVLAERVPLFEAIKVISAWTGHYDYNALDQNAVIGPHPEVTNFLFANGFSGHGLQQGPATGNAIAELVIHGGYRSIDLTRFGYARIDAPGTAVREERDLMRILSISSQVVWGPVGNSAAVPALQARGHEVLSLPTITLSNHPGHGQPAGFRTEAQDMARMLATLEGLGALHGLDAVMTGYFASAGQVEEVSRLLARSRFPSCWSIR
jgi:hypothetical protein